MADKRYTFAYIYKAVEATTDNAFALLEVNTTHRQGFFDRFVETIAAHEYVALDIDQAGWHKANDLKIPESVTAIPAA